MYVLPWSDLHCYKEATQGAGKMLVAWDYWKWSPGKQEWYLCRYSDWYTNSQRQHDLFIQHTFKSFPCYSGWHGTVSWSYTYVNGEWRGGDLWSGAHETLY